jgi:hypothetical protein
MINSGPLQWTLEFLLHKAALQSNLRIFFFHFHYTSQSSSQTSGKKPFFRRLDSLISGHI